MNPILEIILHPICNFYCDYCIAGCTKEALIIDPETGAKSYVERPGFIACDENGDAIVKDMPADITPVEATKVIVDGLLSGEEAIDFKLLLPYIQKNLSGWDIVISGGEPLLYPNIDKYLKELSITNRVILLTNGSRIREHSSLLLNENIFFRIGYHPEYRRKEEFVDSVSFIMAHTEQYVVNYMLHPRHRQNGKMPEYISILEELNAHYEISPYKGDFEGHNFDYYTGLFDKRSLSKHFTEHVPHNEKWLPGKTFLSMYGDGKIYSCHNKRTLHGDVKTGYFSIEEPQQKPFCISDRCHCDSMRAYRNVLSSWESVQSYSEAGAA